MTTRTETITAPDGGTFAAHVRLPESGRGPGLLVLQEIFGVNEYIRDVCRRLAEAGYVAMAPDVFWRIEPGVECGHDDEGLQQAYGYIGRYDWQAGTADLAAALAHLRALPETGGRAGAIGFCMGGTTSFGLACHADPDVVVSYYGSGVPAMLPDAAGVSMPVLFHFGGDDPYIPREQIHQVAAYAAGKPNVTCRVWEAGHAFDNGFAPMFTNPPVAEKAWAETIAWLHQHLPVTEG